MPYLYDAAVVGAGPAGTHLANKLAESGLSTLIIEKYSFPRYKPCGGGVTGKAAEMLPTDWTQIIEDRITGVEFSYKQNTPITLNFSYPIIYTVMRDQLDNILLEGAQNSGAEVSKPDRVIDIKFKDDKFFISTKNAEYQARYLAGADGPASTVRQKLPYNIDIEFAKTVEAEVKIDRQNLERFKNIIWLEYANIKKGYSWIFPKSRHLSIGMGAFISESINLKDQLNGFIKNRGITPLQNDRKFGYPLPYLKEAVGQFHWKNSLLVGDAAGLADPFTGEGIFNALYSADIASKIIIEAAKKNSRLDKYSLQLQQLILPELDKAKKLTQITYSIPGQVFKAVQKNPEIAQKLLEVTAGKCSYADLNSYLKKKLPLLWNS